MMWKEPGTDHIRDGAGVPVRDVGPEYCLRVVPLPICDASTYQFPTDTKSPMCTGYPYTYEPGLALDTCVQSTEPDHFIVVINAPPLGLVEGILRQRCLRKENLVRFLNLVYVTSDPDHMGHAILSLVVEKIASWIGIVGVVVVVVLRFGALESARDQYRESITSLTNEVRETNKRLASLELDIARLKDRLRVE